MAKQRIIERNIDARKHRTSTHLAAADLDALLLEGKSLVFTIKDAWYEQDASVSGDKVSGYFCSFVEPIKDMVINSTNRAIIAGFARKNGHESVDSWNIGNWIGIKIELYVLRDIEAFGKVQDGIRVSPVQPVAKVKPVFTDANFEKAKAAGATLEAIEKVYQITEEVKNLYTEYVNNN